jgi:hypothetical protein
VAAKTAAEIGAEIATGVVVDAADAAGGAAVPVVCPIRNSFPLDPKRL